MKPKRIAFEILACLVAFGVGILATVAWRHYLNLVRWDTVREINNQQVYEPQNSLGLLGEWAEDTDGDGQADLFTVSIGLGGSVLFHYRLETPAHTDEEVVTAFLGKASSPDASYMYSRNHSDPDSAMQLFLLHDRKAPSQSSGFMDFDTDGDADLQVDLEGINAVSWSAITETETIKGVSKDRELWPVVLSVRDDDGVEYDLGFRRDLGDWVRVDLP